MSCYSLHTFFANLISFIVLLGQTTSEVDIRSAIVQFPVNTIATTSLWHTTFDICQDPVHGGFHVRDSTDSHITGEAWIELRDKMRNFHHTLLIHKRSLDRKTCTNTLESIRNYALPDFIRLHRTEMNNQSLAVRTYRTITEMTYILSVLDSAGIKVCCLEDRVIYARLRNQILPEVYNMISAEIPTWQLRDCVLEMSNLFSDSLTCEHVRILTLLVYQFGIYQSQHIIQEL